MDKIIKNYPDFDWEKYKILNPYLEFLDLKTKDDYIENFIKEGRFIGRKYKNEHSKNYSIHVVEWIG